MACVDHAPTPKDLSPSANTTNGSRPPTIEVVEGGKPDLSLYAPACAPHASNSWEAGGTAYDVGGVEG
jgi:hypothetical protein